MLKNLLIALFLLLTINSYAQDDPFAEVKEEAQATLADVDVTEESIAKSLGFDWPVKDPEKSLQDIKKETDELIAKTLKEKFPEKSLESFKAELEKEFPVHKIGDQVSVTFKFRNGSKTQTGPFKEITSKSLNISGIIVPRVDIKESRLISFDPQLRKTYMNRVGNKRFYDYNTERTILGETLAAKYKSAPYKKAGYIFKDGKWTKPSVILKATYDEKMAEIAKIKEAEEKKRKEEEAKFKLLTKSEDGEIKKILGQEPKHVYIGAGVLLLLILGAAVMKK
ncbi:MAG: hypothetical protein NE334_19960 [Lentisphaeraceae bacterium]|nr:hypothetical protein [Lentisphaeraceae bacterium]